LLIIISFSPAVISTANKGTQPVLLGIFQSTGVFGERVTVDSSSVEPVQFNKSSKISSLYSPN